MADTVRYNALSENYSYSQVNIEKSLVAGASLQVEGLTVSFGSGNHRVLALDGLGYLAYQSITYKDFPVMQTIVLLLSVIYVVLTLASDIANAWLDPRIRVA